MKAKPNRTTITMVVTREFKELLRRQAILQNRSMTSYVEWLVLQDAEKTESKKRARSHQNGDSSDAAK